MRGTAATFESSRNRARNLLEPIQPSQPASLPLRSQNPSKPWNIDTGSWNQATFQPIQTSQRIGTGSRNLGTREPIQTSKHCYRFLETVNLGTYPNLGTYWNRFPEPRNLSKPRNIDTVPGTKQPGNLSKPWNVLEPVPGTGSRTVFSRNHPSSPRTHRNSILCRDPTAFCCWGKMKTNREMRTHGMKTNLNISSNRIDVLGFMCSLSAVCCKQHITLMTSLSFSVSFG